MKLPKFPGGLSARVIALMTLALLPLGIISLYQTGSVIQRAQDLAQRALLAETERAVDTERRLLREAVGAAVALGAFVPDLATQPDLCNRVLGEFVSRKDGVVFAGFLARDGRMLCSSTGAMVDFSGSRGFAELVQSPRIEFEVNRAGSDRTQPVMIATVPVFQNAALLGFISVSIPHLVASTALSGPQAETGPKIAVVNRAGRILSTGPDAAAGQTALPQAMLSPDLYQYVGQTFEDAAQDGSTRLFSVLPLFQDELFVVGSVPMAAVGFAQLDAETFLPLALPVLMWLSGMLVAYAGLHRLVIRHVRELRDAMGRFALGERKPAALDLDNPPDELAEAEQAFNLMTLILTDAEKRREQDLHDKTVLLREVHHRVKNNLQLIASMMNMQARKVSSTETKRVLDGLQRRVQGLASIHRSLYATPDMAVVDGADLVRELTQQTVDVAAPGQDALQVEMDVTSVSLYPDQAVPLSMMLSELLTNAIKYAGAERGARPWLRVRLALETDEEVILEVENSRGPVRPDAVEGTGIGSRLMQAFAMQLEAEFDTTEAADRYSARLRFASAEFSPDAVPDPPAG